jgi:hypothetical protein
VRSVPPKTLQGEHQADAACEEETIRDLRLPLRLFEQQGAHEAVARYLDMPHVPENVEAVMCRGFGELLAETLRGSRRCPEHRTQQCGGDDGDEQREARIFRNFLGAVQQLLMAVSFHGAHDHSHHNRGAAGRGIGGGGSDAAPDRSRRRVHMSLVRTEHTYRGAGEAA